MLSQVNRSAYRHKQFKITFVLSQVATVLLQKPDAYRAITITDTSPGVDLERQLVLYDGPDRVFAPFNQATASGHARIVAGPPGPAIRHGQGMRQ